MSIANNLKHVYILLFLFSFMHNTAPFAQNSHDRVRDSIRLENSYLHNNTRAVKKILNKWSRRSISNQKTPQTQSNATAIKLYYRFMDDFMNGKLTGLLDNSENPFCRFVRSPYLFIQSQLKYLEVRTIPDSLRRDVLKIAKLGKNPYPDPYRLVDPPYILSQIEKFADTPRNLPVHITKDFYRQFKNKYSVLPISATEDHRKCLVNFWGYIDIRRRVTAVRYNDPAPEEKKRRLDFLNKALSSDHPEGKIIYLDGELKVGKIYIIDNMRYAAITYQIMECNYVALYNLDRSGQNGYIPFSYCISVE